MRVNLMLLIYKYKLKLIRGLIKMKSLYRTKASSLAKVAALPRHRHPADLINAFQHPFDLQRNQI